MQIRLAADVWELPAAICVEWASRMRTKGLNIHSLEGTYACPIADMMAKAEQIVRVIGGSAHQSCTRGENFIVESDEIFVSVEDARVGRDDVWKVTALGEADKIKQVMADLGASFAEFHSASLNWWYRGPDGVTSTKVALDTPRTFQPLMYPMKPFNGDPLGYMQKYYDSTASILFLLGQPGTGKTSLIREFIWQNELSAFVTYDERVLKDDSMFVEFMGGRRRRGGEYAANHNADLMVLEDVTELLQSREMQKNEMMARFLNVSDGLIQFPHKKMIFTTNLASLKDIDPALLRPGRCYGMVEMRPLFYEEAVTACEAANLPTPFEKRDYSMSELYNQGANLPDASRKVGF